MSAPNYHAIIAQIYVQKGTGEWMAKEVAGPQIPHTAFHTMKNRNWIKRVRVTSQTNTVWKITPKGESHARDYLTSEYKAQIIKEINRQLQGVGVMEPVRTSVINIFRPYLACQEVFS